MSKQEPLVLAVGAAVSALAALCAAPAIAQQENDAIVEQVIVTGARLPKSNISSPAPLIQIGVEEIANRGVARIEEIVNFAPSAPDTAKLRRLLRRYLPFGIRPLLR